MVGLQQGEESSRRRTTASQRAGKTSVSLEEQAGYGAGRTICQHIGKWKCEQDVLRKMHGF